ncbi:MAG TPA: hypothetical protein VFE53_01810 [Mucilaginibacter sp.]|jgi:hypothetical protein|nr:hypothetical protein [Mucilaginibacter sp.]
MKHSINLLAAGLLLSTGLFAAVPAKPTTPKTSPMTRMVSVMPMPTKRGIEVKLNDPTMGKATVIIYDWNNDVVWKEPLSTKKGLDKGLILSQLDNGNYTVEVFCDKQMVAKKTAHVYYRGDTKFVQLRG